MVRFSGNFHFCKPMRKRRCRHILRTPVSDLTYLVISICKFISSFYHWLFAVLWVASSKASAHTSGTSSVVEPEIALCHLP